MSGPHGLRAAAPRDADSVDAVLDLIRANGGRATTSRRTLLEVLFEDSGHKTAEDIGSAVRARAPDVHISTVYRNLEELERLGVVTHTHLGHGPVTYQLATRSHAHLICERCGSRIHAPASLFLGLSRAAKRSLGFQIDPSHVAISGLCADCAGVSAVPPASAHEHASGSD
jgi:Fur family transcriptional regulator, ferric uptake regulator